MEGNECLFRDILPTCNSTKKNIKSVNSTHKEKIIQSSKARKDSHFNDQTEFGIDQFHMNAIANILPRTRFDVQLRRGNRLKSITSPELSYWESKFFYFPKAKMFPTCVAVKVKTLFEVFFANSIYSIPFKANNLLRKKKTKNLDQFLDKLTLNPIEKY